jgi:hypothetical protein
VKSYGTHVQGSGRQHGADGGGRYFELNVASTKAVKLLEIHPSQATEIGDAQEEMILVSVKEGMSSSGSGGATPAAVPASKGDPAYAGTIETHNTTQSSTGTIVTHLAVNWNCGCRST